MTQGPTMIMLLDCGNYLVEWTAAKLKLLLRTVVVLIVVVQSKLVE